jgi:DNA-binding transcriptional MerR regulator
MGDDVMAPNTSDRELYSIGRAASVVGISPATLRIWERRYGAPVPVRLPSGHRRYTDEQVRWLRRVAEAMARGVRPAAAIQADEAALDGMLEGGDDDERLRAEFDRWMRLARDFRGREVADALEQAWRAHGPKRFLFESCAPLITELGRAWADGRVEVRHEHHVTAHLDDLLRSLRRTLPPCGGGPVMILTTLPGEPHGLGVQMVSLLAAIDGVDVRELGTETPLPEIVAAAEETGAFALGLSVSLSSGGPTTDRTLAELRALLPAETRMVVGGGGARGARRGPRDIEYVDGLAGMDAWLLDFAARHARDNT